MKMLKVNKIEKTIACPNCKKHVTCYAYPGEKKIIKCPRCNTEGYFIFPEIEHQNKLMILSINLIPYLVNIVLVLILFFFLPLDYLFILVYLLILVPIFAFFRFDGRIPIVASLVLLILISIAVTIYKNDIFADKLATYAHCLLIVGVLCLLIEFMRE
jgi:integral membrane sensor domain MASE1